MSEPVVQRFFETPLIECPTTARDLAAAQRAAEALADRYTIDVSRPEQARFRWTCRGSDIALDPGLGPDWCIATGSYWVAYMCPDTLSQDVGIMLEDPRNLMTAAGAPGLRTDASPAVERIEASSNRMIMIPGYVRHRLTASQDRTVIWFRVELEATPL